MSLSNVQIRIRARLGVNLKGVKVRGIKTVHNCTTQMVDVSTAARACGKPYPYIYGMCKRNYRSNRANVTVDAVPTPTYKDPGKISWRICLRCVTDFYGTAADNTPQPALLLASPLIAYREWRIENNQLTSYGRDFAWLPGGSEAVCDRRSGHEVPGPKCNCGLYALKEPNPHAYPADVLGQVKLWGRWHSGDRGYRAQFGKPTALLCNDWTRADQIHYVANLYDIPVTHSMTLLQTINWREFRRRQMQQLDPNRLAETTDSPEGGDPDGHWRGDGTRSSDPGRGGLPGDDTNRGPGRAACRTAAASARALNELKLLMRIGEISMSNIEEVLSYGPDADWSTEELDL